jgi:phosphoserine aminotransferase
MENMQQIYFTPGPSQLYPTVRDHILQALEEDIPSLSHRSEKFHTIVKDTYDSLRELLDIPKDYQIFFTASATEAMERIIQNCVEEKSHHFVNGAFSKRFYQIALDLKKSSTQTVASTDHIFDFTPTNPTDAELICLTHNETSVGTSIPTEKLNTDKLLSENRKPRTENRNPLLSLDIVSSVPSVALDYTKLDCVFFSVQKGFGLPAGLGVLIVSPRAMVKAKQLYEQGHNVGSYHKFGTLYEQAQKFQTIETPNVLGIYLFNKVLHDMLETGIATIRKETEEKAALLYDHFDSHPSLTPLIPQNTPSWRSQTVIVIKTPIGSRAIIQHLKTKGFTIGSGYGDQKEHQIRIANFPAHAIKDIKTLLSNF